MVRDREIDPNNTVQPNSQHLGGSHNLSPFKPTRRDLVNIGIALACFSSMLFLVPPVRDFPITDDWCYAQWVSSLLHGVFRPSEYSMATALGHVLWGEGFAALFGMNFTVLSIANLVMAGACLVAFYLLLRHLSVPSQWALLGVALLGANPMFVYLSYSFMTDVTFVTYSVISLVCYVRGAQYARAESGPRRVASWLLMGSIFAGLAYLTRQLGLLLPAVVLGYFWWTGQWLESRGSLRRWDTWWKPLVIGTLPVVSAVLFTVWQRSFPMSVAAYVETTIRASNYSNIPGFLGYRSMQVVNSLFLIGLMILPVVSLPRKPMRVLPLWVAMVVLQVEATRGLGTLLPENWGNILDHTGFLTQDFPGSPVLTEWIWATAVLISLSVVALTAYAGVRAGYLQLVRARRDGRPATPGLVNSALASIKVLRQRTDEAWIVYMFAVLLVGATAILSYTLMDRYWLPAMPAVIVACLRQGRPSESSRPHAWRWALATPLALLAILGQQDYMALSQARWSGAEGLVAHGVARNQIFMGIEWSGWYLADAGAQYFHQHGNTGESVNPTYAVMNVEYGFSTRPVGGYRPIGNVPFSSLLQGNSQVLILARERTQGSSSR